jgi:DNA recombination protein RmuC
VTVNTFVIALVAGDGWLAVVAALLAGLAGLAGGLVVARASGKRGAGEPAVTNEAAIGAAVAGALAELQQQAAGERDAAVHAALQQAAVIQRQQLDQVTAHHRQLLEQSGVLQREQLGAQLAASERDLAAKKDVIDSRLDQVTADLRAQMERLGQLVGQLGQRNAEQFGMVDASLRAHAEITQTLSASTQSLREALANPKSRGQWGERMAEDVLRLAGFLEHVHYERQTAVEGTRALPDFTFLLPKGQALYMDVKFPLTSYLRFLEAGTEAERQAHRDAFLRDVRTRVRELAQREYATIGERPAIDYVLLFLPNETVSSFVLEHDPELIDHALRQKVVLCSPLTLFAFLGVIRQAFDNFVIEQTSDEILRLLGTFGQQWGKYRESLAVLERRFDSVHRELEQLNGPRRRQLERPLQQLEDLRRKRGLDIAAELPSADVFEFEGLRDELGA